LYNVHYIHFLDQSWLSAQGTSLTWALIYLVSGTIKEGIQPKVLQQVPPYKWMCPNLEQGRGMSCCPFIYILSVLYHFMYLYTFYRVTCKLKRNGRILFCSVLSQ